MKVVTIRVPHVRAQNPIPPRLVQSVLQCTSDRPRLLDRKGGERGEGGKGDPSLFFFFFSRIIRRGGEIDEVSTRL